LFFVHCLHKCELIPVNFDLHKLCQLWLVLSASKGTKITAFVCFVTHPIIYFDRGLHVKRHSFTQALMMPITKFFRSHSVDGAMLKTHVSGFKGTVMYQMYSVFLEKTVSK